MDNNPENSLKTNSRNESSIAAKTVSLERDDEDPLSIKESSINVLGIILAIMTFLIPISGIYLDRPSPRDNTINSTALSK